jgi:hypothetical protein
MRIAGNSIERLNGDIGRRYERLPKRLGGLLPQDPKMKLGFLVAPSGEHTQSERETLDLLLAAHFPNSVVMETEAAPAAACRARCLDWWVAARIVTYRRVRWAIDSFASNKNPGMDGIFPALLQERQEVLIPYLIRIFCACLPGNWICPSHVVPG